MRRRKIRLKYKKERVLFSDVLPYELPFIFTNRYFYRYLVKNQIRIENEKVVWGDHVDKGALSLLAFMFNKSLADLKVDCSINLKGNEVKKLKRIPFTYRILHKPNKYRELTAVNPVNQIQMVDFYNTYNSLITYYCTLDNFSLRHPNKVACYFYYKDRLHHTLLGKKTDKLELFFNEYENLRTYFSYEKYTNIYKFYEDYRYQRAEKKFEHLLKFDIQSCFDSIYTHSIAWATGGGRDFYKEHFNGPDDGFASKWDSLMQLMNYNETNGIVIGPEFSRLFAEVILQHVDQRVETDLKNKYGFWTNKDYECYRYVDDYFFFFNDDEVKEKAMMFFVNTLKEFKLNISTEKTFLYERPFVTDITRAKILIDELIKEQISYQESELQDEKIEDSDITEDREEVPLDESKIKDALSRYESWYFSAKEFNTRFKAILKTCNVESKDVVNYTLAKICRMLELGLKKFDRTFKMLSKALTNVKYQTLHSECISRKETMEMMLGKLLIAVLDSTFFLYSGNKRVNTTLKVLNILNDIIITLDNDYEIDKVTVKRFSDFIRDNVFKKIQDEIALVFQTSNIDENTQLESLYFLIILRSLRSKYHISPYELEKYIGVKSQDANKIYPKLNTLSILILLYYFGNEVKYREMKSDLMNYVMSKYDSSPMATRRITTELTILTLDLLACPYISKADKLLIADKMSIPIDDANKMLKYYKKHRFMFTRWEGVDITKELIAKISQEVYS